VLAQDVALPVAVQMCGPSEIRYVARLAAAHELLRVPVPSIAPRSHWAFVPPRAERLSRDLGADPVRVAAGTEALVPAPPAAERPEVAALREAVGRLPGGGSAAVQRRRASLTQGVEAYAEALARDAAEGGAVRAERIRKALALLRPDGEGQDRRLSPLPWIVRLGTAFLPSSVWQDAGPMRVIRVDGAGR
jgi:hypothetical protein